MVWREGGRWAQRKEDERHRQAGRRKKEDGRRRQEEEGGWTSRAAGVRVATRCNAPILNSKLKVASALPPSCTLCSASPRSA